MYEGKVGESYGSATPTPKGKRELYYNDQYLIWEGDRNVRIEEAKSFEHVADAERRRRSATDSHPRENLAPATIPQHHLFIG